MRKSLLFAFSKQLAFSVSLFLGLQSCQDQGSLQSMSVPLKNTETFQYAAAGGDEEGAIITKQAQNFNISEIRRNASTNYVATYFYQPRKGFIGTEYAEIEIHWGSDGTPGTSRIKTVSFHFIVSN